MSRKVIALGVALLFVVTMDSRAGEPIAGAGSNQRAPVYDADGSHLWNRLHVALWVRKDREGNEYGHDLLNPLIWRNTKFLVEGESHRRALAVLDEFLNTRGERRFADPVKRAVLQQDLWAVFDATHKLDDQTDGRRAAIARLRQRLVVAIQRLAMEHEMINKLPNNYALAVASKTTANEFDPSNPNRAFLSPDLLDANGTWVCIRGGFSGPSALAHVRAFGGRSPFVVYIRLPTGRQATLDYLARLNRATDAVTARRDWMKSLPQFPVGTAVALTRRLTVIDHDGKIIVTPLVQSVQTRVYRQVGTSINHGRAQSAFKFTLKRRQLFAGESGGLKLTPPTEIYVAAIAASFVGQRLRHNHDLFEGSNGNAAHLTKRTNSCVACHTCGGGGTVASIFTFNQSHWLDGADSMLPTDHRLTVATPVGEYQKALLWKQSKPTWESLKSYWGSKHSK